MVSHNLEQNVIDGEKTINNCLPEAQSKDSETHEFKLHEVMITIEGSVLMSGYCAGVRRGRAGQHRRGQEPGAGRQDDSIQEDRSDLHAQDEDKPGVLQWGEQVLRIHALQHPQLRGGEEGSDGRRGVCQAPGATAIQCPLREGRMLRSSVQIHCVADAQWSHENHR